MRGVKGDWRKRRENSWGMYHKRALCPSQTEDTHTEVSLQWGSFSHQTHVMPSEQEAQLINSEEGVLCVYGLIQAC